MRIPKYITHPLLMLIVGSATMSLLWLDAPSASDLEAVKNAQQDPSTIRPIDFKQMLKDKKLYQIEDITSAGGLIIPELEQQWKLNDKRFQRLSPAKLEHLRGFFVGKFIKIEDISQNNGINLPAELYNPLCFSNNQDHRTMSNQCPVILNP